MERYLQQMQSQSRQTAQATDRVVLVCHRVPYSAQKTMRYCTECLQPDTRPNTVFDEKGVCPACNFSKKIKLSEWKKQKWDLSIEAFKNYIKKYLIDVEGYNCCLGVSGGKDSTRQALFARDILGLKPKLICLSFPPDLMTVTGANNLANLSDLGFQVEIFSAGPRDWKRLMREALYKFGNPLVPTELALYSSVPKQAIKNGLKLILWGENPALQLGDLNTMGANPFDGNNIRNTNTVKQSADDWIENLEPQVESLYPYLYPSVEEYESNGLQTVYMGPVMYDWSLLNNSISAAINGIEIRREKPINIGDLYGVSALDQHITPFNQVIKYLKVGFGKMTDYANEEIRLGRMTRKEAIRLIEKYDGKCSKGYFRQFANYLGMDYVEFWNILDKHVNNKLFQRISIDEYAKKFTVGEGL